MPRPKTFTTSIDLSAESRRRMVPLLNQQLADLSDLCSQAKQAHWNVKGAQFSSLHELYDKLAEELEGFVDLVAERVTALGGTALGTVRQAATTSRLPEYPLNGVQGLASVKALAARYAALATSTRAGIDDAARAGDAGTSDLLTEVSRALDKSLWFLEAHLQK